MDARYALITWRAGAKPQAAIAIQFLAGSASWRLQERGERFALFVGAHDRSPPMRLADGGWVPIGEVFDRQSGAPLILRSDQGPGIDRLEAQARRWVVRTFGRYVLLNVDPLGQAGALRDPSGAMETLAWRSGGLSVIASDLDDALLRAVRTDLSLDWARVDTYAHHPTAIGVGSGLKSIVAIDPGAIGRFEGERLLQTPVWRPADFIAPSPHSKAALLEELREAVRLSVGAYDAAAALAEVSGGLDSAIVAQARRPVSAQTLWLTYYGQEAEADERRYARAVAEHLGLHLAEIPSVEQVLAFSDSGGPFGPRPSLNGLDAQMDRAIAAQAEAFAAEIILTGQGGDAVFFRSRTGLILADALVDRVPPARLLRLAVNLAHWTRRSVWSIGTEAIRARRGARQTAGPDGFSHPWLDLPVGTPPAKAAHVRQILAAQGFNGASRRGKAARLVHPLLSQPVVELCLGVPTYRLTEGVRDRALARAAFAPALPALTVERRSKGDMTRHYGRMIARSLPELRPFLMDGLLADRGILDRAGLESQLTTDELIVRGDYAAILQWVAVEAWARRARAAAAFVDAG